MEIGKMRRRTREIKEKSEIEAILDREKVCHLAMSVDDQPYVIPLLYVYQDGVFYMHCAEVGTKLDMIAANSRVCIEVESCREDDLVRNTDMPCMWGLVYESAVAFGQARISDDREEKLQTFDMLVEKIHTEGYEHSRDKYLEKRLNGSRLIIVKADSLTGKKWNGVK